jgi:hypothetical protein
MRPQCLLSAIQLAPRILPLPPQEHLPSTWLTPEPPPALLSLTLAACLPGMTPVFELELLRVVSPTALLWCELSQAVREDCMKKAVYIIKVIQNEKFLISFSLFI